MIVVDTSALIAIARDEPAAEVCMDALEDANRVLISAATVTESLIVAHGRGVETQMSALFDHFGLEVVPVTDFRARAAAQAYRRYGKGWHAAALNFRDSFAYALAKEHGCALLYAGDGFARTDAQSAV